MKQAPDIIDLSTVNPQLDPYAFNGKLEDAPDGVYDIWNETNPTTHQAYAAQIIVTTSGDRRSYHCD